MFSVYNDLKAVILDLRHVIGSNGHRDQSHTEYLGWSMYSQDCSRHARSRLTDHYIRLGNIGEFKTAAIFDNV